VCSSDLCNSGLLRHTMNNRIANYTLDLGDGTRCRGEIDFRNLGSLPPEELPNVIKMDCVGPWGTSQFDQYLPWIADLWQAVADAANKSFSARLYSPRGETVFVIVQPGLRPEFHSSLQLSLW